MAASEEDLSFLSFFLTEPVYLLPEAAPDYVTEAGPLPQDLAEQEAEHSESAEENKKAKEQLSDSDEVMMPLTQGLNRKGVLILYHQPAAESLAASSVALLEKILKAVQLDMDDVALCNWALLEQQQAAQSNIFESLQLIDCDMIIAFGDLPMAWSMRHFFQKYHITQEASGKALLQADDLPIIAQNRDYKVKLWESLQKLFK